MSANIDAAGALEAFETLLREVATGLVPTRAHAIDYVNHRATLLAAPLAPALPGFVQQCQSVSRFKDFIGLYDREATRRLAFIEASFAPCRGRLATGPVGANDDGDRKVWRF